MSAPAPAQPGMSLQHVDTPALLLDVDILARNIEKMSTAARRAQVKLWPHIKTHKASAIAKMQLDSGAWGICCQKLSEAEAMLGTHVKRILITNEIVGKEKVRRLAALSTKCDLVICADNLHHVELAAAAARIAARPITMLVDISLGESRPGIQPGDDMVALATNIKECPNLKFNLAHTYLWTSLQSNAGTCIPSFHPVPVHDPDRCQQSDASPASRTALLQPPVAPASFTHRNPICSVELSGVFAVRAATRYRLQ